MTLDFSSRARLRQAISEKQKERRRADLRREAALRIEETREDTDAIRAGREKHRADHWKAECAKARAELGVARREVSQLRRTATGRGVKVDKLTREVRALRKELREEKGRARRLEERVRQLRRYWRLEGAS